MNKSKPSIYFIVEWFYPVIGGAGKQAFELAKQLQNQYNITILTRQVQNAPRIEEIDGISIHRFGLSGKGKLADYSAAMNLHFYLTRNRKRIDLIHIHGNLENNFAVAAELCAKKQDIPFIAKLAIAGEMKNHLESDNYSENEKFVKSINPLNKIRRQIAREVDCYIAISNDIKNELIEIGIPKEKVVYIPNGVDTEYFKIPSGQSKTAAKKQLGIEKDTEVYITVSRLAKHKGILNPLLSMWKEYFATDANKILFIIGSGEGLSSSIEQDVSNFVKKYKLTNVRLEGRKENVLPYYFAADYFILPSENEGLSNALLEAASCGVTCIVSRVSGNTDLIETGKTGFLFAQKSESDLHATILDAHSHDRTQIQKKLHSIIHEQYALTQIAKKIAKLYTQFLEK